MSTNLIKFRQLSEIKQKAVKLKAEGQTLEVIAAETGVAYPTIESWVLPSGLFGEEVEEYKAFLADKQIQSTEEFQARAAKDAIAVWEKLLGLALSDDSAIPQHVILGAMDSVLDRAGIARVSKTEGKHSLAVTDEDRAKRFREIAELQKDLQPEQLLRLASGAKG